MLFLLLLYLRFSNELILECYTENYVLIFTNKFACKKEQQALLRIK